MKKETALLFVLAAVQFTHIVDFMIMMPMGDILQKELDITPFLYSLIVAAYPVAAFLSSLFGVFFLDRFDRKKALMVAYTGFLLGTVSSAYLPTTDSLELNYQLFVGTRLLTGLFGGILSALVLAIVGDVFELERRGKAMGIVMTAFSLAAVLGVPLALQLVNWFDGNWHVPFIMVSIVGVPVWLVTLFSVPPLRSHLDLQTFKPHPFTTIRVAAKSPNQLLALLFMMLLVLGQFTIIPFITPYMINNVGLTQEQIPFIYLVGGACTVVSSPLIGRVVDRYGRKRVFYTMASLSLIPLLLITNLPQTPLWLVLCLMGFFFIVISGRMIPANTLMTSVVKPENRGGFLSLNASMTSLASGLSSMIAGSIVTQSSEHQPIGNYYLVGFLAVTATLLAVYLATRLVELDNKQDQIPGH